MNKTEEVLVNNKILRAAVLPLPEPFMSLLLVLSHMDFKLDMEVRAATVIFSITLNSDLIRLFFSCIQNCSFLDESWLLPVRASQ